METKVDRGPGVEPDALMELSARLDAITDVLDAYCDEVPAGLGDTLTQRLGDVADDIDSARRRAHTAAPARQRTWTGIGSSRRRRTLADRFAEIAVDAEFDHLSERVRHLGSRLDRNTLHTALRPLPTDETPADRSTVG